MARWRLGLVACVAGCPATAPEPVPGGCDGAPEWDTFAEGYIRTWCAPCHAASVGGADRQGAPDGVDFDRWSEVYAWRDRIEARATGPSPDMPPLGGVGDGQTELLEQWLACGATGSDAPPGPCADRRDAGAATITGQADADALCDRGNVASSLEVAAGGEVSLGCLCAVDGDLTLAGGALSAPLLTEVGGSLRATGGSLEAPALAGVGGALSVSGAVSGFEVPMLASVGGSVDLIDLGTVTELSFAGLRSVGGALTVARDGRLRQLVVPRLREVGGSATFEALPALVALEGTRSLEQVGGDLVVNDLRALPVLDDWAFLLLGSVGGSVRITGNDALRAIHGVTVLADVPGDVVIEDNASLVRIDGFDNLRRVAGDLQIRANPRQESVFGFVNLTSVEGALTLEALPALIAVPGFEDLQRVGHLRVVQAGVPGLVWFDALEGIDGDLVVEGSALLERIEGFGVLTAIGGDLGLRYNPLLTGVDGLSEVRSIGGAAVVTDNPSLSTAAVEAWLAGVAVGGAVVVDANGAP